MLEAYAALAGIAARTTRVRLGALVTGVTYRNPALLAKIVTTLDEISGGRAILGIGAAWNESEHRGYGFDFPRIGERMDRMDEALTICRLMFTEERPTFTGRFYRIDAALNQPRPLQAGGPRHPGRRRRERQNAPPRGAPRRLRPLVSAWQGGLPARPRFSIATARRSAVTRGRSPGQWPPRSCSSRTSARAKRACPAFHRSGAARSWQPRRRGPPRSSASTSTPASGGSHSATRCCRASLSISPRR